MKITRRGVLAGSEGEAWGGRKERKEDGASRTDLRHHQRGHVTYHLSDSRELDSYVQHFTWFLKTIWFQPFLLLDCTPAQVQSPADSLSPSEPSEVVNCHATTIARVTRATTFACPSQQVYSLDCGKYKMSISALDLSRLY